MPRFPRERLHARIDAARRAPVTLVVADEALGKSSLVREYLALRALPHVRFTVASEHASVTEFLRGLAAAFGQTNRAMASSSGRASLQFGQADGETAALTWAREHLAGISTTVVLDELHTVLGEPRIAAFLTALIDATVPGLRWILIARDAAALPMPRWLATGVAELPIESADLLVQPEELVEAIEARGVALDDASLVELYQRSGGWALGLSVALAGGHLDEPLDREHVYERVVERALRHFGRRERDRLYETALFGRFDGTILAALECESAVPRALAATGLVHASDDGDYTYYEPYRERIRRRLDALGAAERHAILDRAAGALQRVGRWPEAIALRVGEGDEESLADTLEARGFAALDHGDIATVRLALSGLSEAVVTRRAVALAMRAALASLEESFDVSEAWFRMAIDAAHADERREIVIRYGMDLVRRGRTDVIELLELEAKRDETRANADADAAMWALLGTAYVETHRGGDAREAARRALIRLPGMNDDGLRARVLHQAAYVALNDGDWETARDLAQRALTRADDTFLYDLSARALSVLFNVAMLHDDDVPAARDALARLEEAGRKAGNDALRLYAILNAYALEVDAGDARAIERSDTNLHEMQLLITPRIGEALLPAQALRAAWSGRFEHAYDMLARGVDSQFDDDRRAYRWAEIAVYAAAASKMTEAAEAIGRGRENLRRIDTTQALAVRTTAYLAIAEFLLGRDTEAQRLVEEAAAAPGTVRLTVLLDAVRALHRCRWGGVDALLALDTAIDALDDVDLGGVGRFIGMLPLCVVDALTVEQGVGVEVAP